MNIVLLKHGTKYTAADVNKQALCIKKYTNNKIYCFTEDRSDVVINCIDIPRRPKLMRWWNKMHLFRNDFPLSGQCVLFDLDILIKDNPFKFIEKVDWNYPTFIRRKFKMEKFFREHSYDTELNSSILTWTSHHNTYIWDMFNKNIDYHTRKYKGIDRFFWHEKIEWRQFDYGISDTIDLQKNT